MGPRKLLAYLIHRYPRYTGWPVASTVGVLLKREGLVRARRRRPAPGHPGRPLTPMDAPNALSRYLLACRGLESIATGGTRSVVEGIFRTYGLPDRIRTDNGPPSRPAR